MPVASRQFSVVSCQFYVVQERQVACEAVSNQNAHQKDAPLNAVLAPRYSGLLSSVNGGSGVRSGKRRVGVAPVRDEFGEDDQSLRGGPNVVGRVAGY